jgi:phosphoglycolate phosphatase
MYSLNTKNFDAIVFDMDGTLVDSLPDMIFALNRLLSDHGRRKLTKLEVRPLIGRGAIKMLQSAFELSGKTLSEDNFAKALASYKSYYKEFPAKNSKVYESVRTVLDKLREADIKMGICSNKDYELVCLILESFDLAKYFCAVTGGDNVAFNKPDGRHILETLKLMGVSGKNVLMVGDTADDIVAANDIGLPVVAVEYSYSDPDELSCATAIIDNFGKLNTLK